MRYKATCGRGLLSVGEGPDDGLQWLVAEDVLPQVGVADSLLPCGQTLTHTHKPHQRGRGDQAVIYQHLGEGEGEGEGRGRGDCRK